MSEQDKTQTEEVKETVTTDPSSETTEVTEKTEVVEEKPLPFHEHPRFKEVIEEKNALANQVKDLASRLEEVNKQLSPKEAVKAPSWLAKSVGENPEIYEEFNSWLTDLENRVETRAIEKFQSTQSKEKQQAQQWEKYVNDSVAKLQADGKKFDRNELLAITEKYLPTDEKGNIDFGKAYELYELSKKGTATDTTAQKKVAATATTDKVSDGGTSKAKTWQDFKGKSPF